MGNLTGGLAGLGEDRLAALLDPAWVRLDPLREVAKKALGDHLGEPAVWLRILKALNDLLADEPVARRSTEGFGPSRHAGLCPA